jgi:type I restriction enzyme S subunit
MASKNDTKSKDIEECVPKLRFKGFGDSWKLKKFGDAYVFLKNNSLSRSDMTAKNVGYPQNIHYGDIHMKLPSHMDAVEIKRLPFISVTVNYNNDDLIRNGDLLIADASEDYADIGKTIEIVNTGDKDILAGLHTILARPTIGIAGGFGAFMMKAANLRRQIMRIANGVSVIGISKSNLSNVTVLVPSLPEQHKIALFLTTLDKIITLQTKKLEALNRYKQGIMQKIFSQEVRFRDEEKEFERWGAKTLGEIGKTYSGLTGKSGDDFSMHGNAKFIQYMQVFSNPIVDDNFGKVFIDVNETQNTCTLGDIFFTGSSETPEEVGMSSVILKSIGDLYLNSFCFGYRYDQTILLPEYAVFVLRSPSFRNKVARIAQGSTRFNLSKIELMKQKIELPTIDEQIRISGFLMGLDEIIISQNVKLNHTRSMKEALLQRMLG